MDLSMTGLYEKCKRAFLALPTILQWAIITLIKSIAASTLLSFLAIYATAIFAIRHGFRAPVEGAPFLQFAIALATFATFAATIIMFSVLMLLFRQVTHQMDFIFSWVRMSVKLFNIIPQFRRIAPAVEEIQNVTTSIFTHKIVLFVALISLLCSILILLDTRIATTIFSILPSKTFDQPGQFVVGLVGFSIILVAMWCVHNNMNWIAAQIFAAAIILAVMAVALFANDVYGSFLRIVRYGGGISATVKYIEGDKGATSTMTGSLLILTTTHVIMFDEHKHEIVEIPSRSVVTLQYGIHPPWKLPEYTIQKQRDFIDLDASKLRMK